MNTERRHNWIATLTTDGSFTRRLLILLLWGLLLGLGSATLFGFLGRLAWPFELLSHFRTQYAVLLGLTALLFALAGHWRGVATALVLLAANLVVITPALPGSTVAIAAEEPPVTADTQARLKAVAINVYWRNQDTSATRAYLERVDPDVVLLVEAGPAFARDLAAALPAYSLHGAPQNNADGIALLSRLPIHAVNVERLSPVGRPAIVAELTVDGIPLTLLGVHPYAPVSPSALADRTAEFAAIADYVSAQSQDTLVFGDLNTTPWSPFFQDFMREAGLYDARIGHGIHPTWPAQNPLLQIPIDQALVSQGIRVHEFDSGPNVGSDHLPIFIDVSLSK